MVGRKNNQNNGEILVIFFNIVNITNLLRLEKHFFVLLVINYMMVTIGQNVWNFVIVIACDDQILLWGCVIIEWTNLKPYKILFKKEMKRIFKPHETWIVIHNQ